MTERIWIYGAGAIGSVLASLLAGKAEVTLVGSSVHAERVKTAGLRITFAGTGETRTVPIPVCCPEELPALGERDIVLLTGKIRSLPAAAAILRDKLAPGTTVVALQNGLGFEAELAQQLGHPMERGIVQFGAGSEGDGSVRYFPGRVLLPPGRVAGLLSTMLAGTPIECRLETNFPAALWNKLLINSVANALAGILGINNRNLAGETLNPVKAEIVREAKAVAAAAGVDLTATLETLTRYLATENVPSLVRDLRRGLPTEIDWINGAVVRLGAEYGIPTPVNASLVAMIKCLEQQNQKKEG